MSETLAGFFLRDLRDLVFKFVFHAKAQRRKEKVRARDEGLGGRFARAARCS